LANVKFLVVLNWFNGFGRCPMFVEIPVASTNGFVTLFRNTLKPMALFHHLVTAAQAR